MPCSLPLRATGFVPGDEERAHCSHLDPGLALARASGAPQDAGFVLGEEEAADLEALEGVEAGGAEEDDDGMLAGDGLAGQVRCVGLSV